MNSSETAPVAQPSPGAAPTGDAPPERDRALRRLFAMAPLAAACPQLGYACVGFFAALQVQSLDGAHKVEQLALVHAAMATASMIAQPLIGVLSDRTRTRYGARTPWMLSGAIVACVALVAAGMSTSVAMLMAIVVVAHIGLNAFGGPFSALQPDLVPVERRGRYSALAGLGTISAGILGPAIGSGFAAHVPLGYIVVATILLVTVLVFLALNPGVDNRAKPRAAFSFSAFAKAFWVNPARYPDFWWMFLGRFLICGGFYMITTYQLYILEDYIGLTVHEATRLTPVISLSSMPGFIIAIAVCGQLSDRIGRRKPIVLVGGLIIAVSALVPLAFPTVAGIIGSIVVLTIGFGVFLAVDQALVTQVLPNAADSAKDLGVINIAATLPNTVAPMIAATIVTTTGGYGSLYPIVALIAGLGALAVLPVRAR